MCIRDRMCTHILLVDKGKGILSGEVAGIKDRYRQGIYKVDIDIQAEQRGQLEAIDEFAGWEEDARSIKPYALFKLANLSDPNALLAKLATMGQIHSFAEQMPTVSDIFFKAVEGEGGITASEDAL